MRDRIKVCFKCHEPKEVLYRCRYQKLKDWVFRILLKVIHEKLLKLKCQMANVSFSTDRGLTHFLRMICDN